MDNKELIKLAYYMGAHPYSVGGMVAALQKGIEIGKAEQKAEDEANPSDKLIMLILNCIGYEEESWIGFVRKELEKRKKEE